MLERRIKYGGVTRLPVFPGKQELLMACLASFLRTGSVKYQSWWSTQEAQRSIP